VQTTSFQHSQASAPIEDLGIIPKDDVRENGDVRNFDLFEQTTVVETADNTDLGRSRSNMDALSSQDAPLALDPHMKGVRTKSISTALATSSFAISQCRYCPLWMNFANTALVRHD
jgi:hypothetical protein